MYSAIYDTDDDIVEQFESQCRLEANMHREMALKTLKCFKGISIYFNYFIVLFLYYFYTLLYVYYYILII